MRDGTHPCKVFLPSWCFNCTFSGLFQGSLRPAASGGCSTWTPPLLCSEFPVRCYVVWNFMPVLWTGNVKPVPEIGIPVRMYLRLTLLGWKSPDILPLTTKKTLKQLRNGALLGAQAGCFSPVSLMRSHLQWNCGMAPSMMWGHDDTSNFWVSVSTQTYIQ